ncbi:MAG: MFS transporter [Burkholderiales bacterium]|nr:MFS transporter [Burkholderiales bacterium]
MRAARDAGRPDTPDGPSTPPAPDASLQVSMWLGGVLVAASLALVGVAALAPRILETLALPPTAIGLFSSVVWGTAILASSAGGALVARWGAWRVSRACPLLCAAGLLAVASGEPWLFWLGAVVIGLGQGIETPPSSQLLGHHVPIPKRPLYFSLKQSGVQVGAVLASLGLPAIALVWGWRAALVAVVVVLVGFASTLGVPARRFPVPDAPRSAPSGLRSLLGWARPLRRRPGLMRLSLAAAAFGATQVCVNSFLVTWAVLERDLDLAGAGLLAATAQGAGLLARPLWGWVASRAGDARVVLRALGLVMAACGLLLGVFGAQWPMVLLAPLAACYGLSASGWNGVFLAEVATRADPAEIASTSAAAMVPLFLGLVVGPLAFAAAGQALGLSSGFVVMAAVSLAGVLLLPGNGGR